MTRSTKQQAKQQDSKTAIARQLLFKVNLRQLMFATIMGSLALVVRNVGLFIMVYPPFRIDPRWIFSLLGACWTGPAGGLITGVLAAWHPPYPQADLACIPVHFIIGLTSSLLIQHNQRRLFSCFLWPILGVPLYMLTFSVFYSPPVAIIYVPVVAFIGVTTSILAFVVGLLVEKRARPLLNLLHT